MGKVATVVLIFFALVSNLHLFRETMKFDPKLLGGDEITLYEKRFEELKKMLPPRGVVGYISNRQAQDMHFDLRDTEYFLTQYALVPLIVAHSSKVQLVVGNFRTPITDPKVFTSRHLYLVKDFGNGVILFSHQGQ